MTCRVCEKWTPSTIEQWTHRRNQIELNPQIQIHPCPACGGTDYMLDPEYVQNLGTPGRRPHERMINYWIVVGITVLAIASVLWSIIKWAVPGS